jgi:thiol-disulfide isomerase/thioredoxin
MSKKNLLAYIAIAVIFAGAGVYMANKKNTQAAGEAAASAATAAPASPLSPAVQSLYGQQLKDLGGATQSLSQWKGKALVVNFWAPWCGPCVREMPELSALQKEVAGKNIQVIGIGIDSPSNLSEFAGKMQIAYPVYVGGLNGTDLSRALGNDKGALPYTVLIGADGQIKKTYLGGLKFDQLRADLASL